MKFSVISAAGFAAAIMVAGGNGQADAATITSAGSVIDDAGSQISQFQTLSTAKTMDPDGDGQYGTLAALEYGNTYKNGGTTFSFDTSQQQVGPFSGYATVDKLSTGPYLTAAARQTIQVDTTTNGGGQTVGTVNQMFNFTVLTAATPNFRVGIVVDGLNGTQFDDSAVGLGQFSGTTLGTPVTTSTSANNNNALDIYFFDVRNAAMNDKFSVVGLAGSGGYATNQIVTFDALAAIPEPASLSLLGLGALGLLARRHRA